MNFLFGSIFHLPRWHIKRLHWGDFCFAWRGCSLQFFDATLFGWWLAVWRSCLLPYAAVLFQPARQTILILYLPNMCSWMLLPCLFSEKAREKISLRETCKASADSLSLRILEQKIYSVHTAQHSSKEKEKNDFSRFVEKRLFGSIRNLLLMRESHGRQNQVTGPPPVNEDAAALLSTWIRHNWAFVKVPKTEVEQNKDEQISLVLGGNLSREELIFSDNYIWLVSWFSQISSRCRAILRSCEAVIQLNNMSNRPSWPTGLNSSPHNNLNNLSHGSEICDIFHISYIFITLWRIKENVIQKCARSDSVFCQE